MTRVLVEHRETGVRHTICIEAVMDRDAIVDWLKTYFPKLMLVSFEVQ